ncbi:MAG TPA: hypothetical protein VF334_02795 [Polyangia bacterium]
MTGELVVGTVDLEAARAALARAVAYGALGGGRAVRRDGDGCVFDGGRIDVAADGRVTWSLATATSDAVRVVEAVVTAAVTGVAATLGWSQPIYVALPAGALAGAVYAFVRIGGERRALRYRMRALVASLPVLVDARAK